MACRAAREARERAAREAQAKAATQAQSQPKIQTQTVNSVTQVKTEPATVTTERLLFGVDSGIQASDLLQNNITEFEWVARNKVYPNFWGRNISGENALTKEEIKFIHSKGCKIAALYSHVGEKQTEEQGKMLAKQIDVVAFGLGIPTGTAIFLEIPETENVDRDFMKGYAMGLIEEGYVPAFKVNTDAKFTFDREFSRGLQTDKEVFEKCLIWSVSPSLKEYERVTTTHLIHPDNWMPYAPSGITRKDIAVWQYGKECHPILDDEGKETTFNVNLVRDENIILNVMF